MHAWVIPAGQRRGADAVDAVNELMRQGLEIHRADDSFDAGNVRVEEGDYIARGDQPFRTLADMYMSLQSYSLDNPRPYDDTGWTWQLLRNVEVLEVNDSSILDREMTKLGEPARAPGTIRGRGDVLVVDHTTDNNLMAFRYRHAGVTMLAAEQDFEMNGHEFRAGAFIIPGADRAVLEPSIRELGLSAWATGDIPDVRTHDLDLPRIGYVHSWRSTQNEGWVRGALDRYGIPYDYFDEKSVLEGDLRDRYDVIVYPHVGGDAQAHLAGLVAEGDQPLPYKRTAETPNLGGIDESDDIQGGMGVEGLAALAAFVRAGGTLLVEGSTAAIFPTFGLTPGVVLERPEELVAPGSIHRGVLVDASSPIAYGYDEDQLPVFYRGDVVLRVGRAVGGAGGPDSPWQNTTPMARAPDLAPLRLPPVGDGPGNGDAAGGPFDAMRERLREGDAEDPRVVFAFPDDPNLTLLSGTLGGGEALAGRAQVVDAPLGQGHVVMFSIRPFWRWQTQGTFFLGFNTILNWNDLGAGRSATPPVS